MQSTCAYVTPRHAVLLHHFAHMKVFCACRRFTSYGVAFWASQRLVELTYANISTVFMGTWALNAIYRILGASVGSYTSFRKVAAVNVPDMLKMGKL